MIDIDYPELFFTADRIVVCVAHVDKYLDSPLVMTTPWDYDVWARTHDTPMTCHRCEMRHHDENGNPMAADFLGTIGSAWGERTDSVGETDREIARCFDSILTESDVND